MSDKTVIHIVFQEDPCGGEVIVGVYDNRDSANACWDAGEMVGLARRVEKFTVESKYQRDEDYFVLIEEEDV